MAFNVFICYNAFRDMIQAHNDMIKTYSRELRKLGDVLYGVLKMVTWIM